MRKTVIVKPGEEEIYVSVLAGNEIRKTMTIAIEPGSGLCDSNMRKVGAMLREEGVRNCSAGTIISDEQCIFRTVRDDLGDRDRIFRKLMESLGEEMRMNDDEDYVFDCQQVAGSDNEYLCVITRRSLVTDYQAAFVRNNLRLDYLIPECVAIGNIVRNSGLSKENPIFVDLNPRRTLIRVYSGSECIAQHEINSDAGSVEDQIGKIKGTLDYYDENNIADSDSSGVYVYGEGATVKSTLRSLKKELGRSIYSVRNLLGCAIDSDDASLLFSAIGVVSADGAAI